MNKLLSIFVFLAFSITSMAQNVGVGTPTALMKLHVSNADSAVLLLENTQLLSTNMSNAIYFKTGNGGYPYTGAIKTIGTGTFVARMGLFTYASSTANGLLERLSITDEGKVGIGTVSPLKKLHLQANGTSLLTSAFGDGLLFSTNASSGTRIFLENLNGPVNQKSLTIVNENINGQGTTYFGSLSDNGGSWVNHLLSMNHANGNVGVSTLSPHPSAALDVTSTTKGFLPPRMTTAERNAITPTEGLMIYNTDTKKPNYFDGTEWRKFDGSTARNIGDAFQGGIIAYILQPGDPGYDANITHGIISAPSDQSIGALWGCSFILISGADGTVLGTGNQNTIDIMAGCATLNIAARICGDLVLNSYSDWYLPSKDELNKLYLARVTIGGFADDIYWSSSEIDGSNTARCQNFGTSGQYPNSKDVAGKVRAVRTF